MAIDGGDAPAGAYGDLPDAARAALDELVARASVTQDVVGLVLTGSAARGRATEHSDIDVYVVLADTPAAPAAPDPRRSALVDEIPVTMAELADVAAFGTPGWWHRWSFAWARVPLDRTGGEVERLVRRQATLSPAEQHHLLIDGDRLDGWLNFAYRAAKSARAGRRLEQRFDAAESVPWLLDVVFTLAGRVRPYGSYLAWELRTHPLEVREWSAERLLPQLEAMLDGDLDAVRAAYAVVERECRRYDAARGSDDLAEIIDGWGDDLHLLR